jgi:hypothetical protein
MKFKLPDFKTFLIFGLLLVIVGGYVFRKTEYGEADRIRNEQILKDAKQIRTESLKEASDEREKRKAIEAENLTLQARIEKEHSYTIYWQNQFKHEKNKNYSLFSDAEYDSLITRLYPNKR